MPPQTTRNAPPQSSPAQQSPLGALIDQGLRTAKAAVDVAANVDLPKAAQSLASVMDTLVNSKGSIQKLDAKVQNLNKDAPGTTKLVRELAAMFKEVSTATDAVDPKLIPAKYKPAVDATKATAASFKKFSDDYDTYTTAPEYKLMSYSTWGVKSGAAVKALGSWNAFKKDFARAETEIGKIDPVQLGEDLIKGSLNIVRDALKKVP